MKHHLIIGPPGTGKTTEVARQVRRSAEAHGKVLVASFTKAAAVEVAGRGLGVDPEYVGTLHKICLNALDRPKLAIETLQDFAVEYPQYQIGRIDGDAEIGVMAAIGADALGNLDTLRSKMIPKSLWSPQDLAFADVWDNWKLHTGTVDFTDLIEMALEKLPVAPGNPKAIYYDEAQDGSKLELALIKSWAKHADNTVMVGDEDQTLYRWRGADPQAFLSFSDKPRILDQSYRLSEAVWHEAMRWIHLIPVKRRLAKAYKPTDKVGELVHSPASLVNLDPLCNAIREDLTNGLSVMVLASTNQHVQKVVAALKADGIPFHNQFRPLRTDWNAHYPIPKRYPGKSEPEGTCESHSIPGVSDYPANASMRKGLSARNPPTVSKKTYPPSHVGVKGYLRHTSHRVRAFCSPAQGVAWTWTSLVNWMDMVKKAAIHDTPDVTTYRDREYEVVPHEELTKYVPERVIMMAEDGDVSWLLENCLARFRKPLLYPATTIARSGLDAFMAPANVTVGTIHSVKGGEADSVYLFPDLSRAGHEAWMGTEADDVVRTFYVGMTRARLKLTLCDPARWMGVKWLPAR